MTTLNKCQIIDWLNFEIRPSSLRDFGYLHDDIYYNYQNALRISFLSRFLFRLKNRRTTTTNYLRKENRQSIFVAVAIDVVV